MVKAVISSYLCPSYGGQHVIEEEPGVFAAVGSYALCMGSGKVTAGASNIGPVSNNNNVKCANDGMFMYGKQRKIREITDGTSKTFAIGEARDIDTLEGPGPNLWSYAYSNSSSLRSTANAMNLPPCTPANAAAGICGKAYNSSQGPTWNGSFGSEHRGGANFVFVDGHVSFIDENVDFITYQNTASIDEGLEPSRSVSGFSFPLADGSGMNCIRHSWCLWPAVLLGISSVCMFGCDDGRPKRVHVSGKVLIDGQPLKTGYIQFIPQGARPAGGKIDSEGRFQLTCFDPGDGAVVGKHRVTVTASEFVSPTQTKWFAPKKYGDVTNSGLQQEITGPTDDVVINLTWDGGKPFVERTEADTEGRPKTRLNK